MTEPRKYRAFISYSHRDAQWGTWLHKAIEHYRVPRALIGRETRLGPVPNRLFPVFRDREELPTASDLGRVIEKALSDSEFLIVICSPNSAQSKWVNEEILQFKRIHGEDRILAIIVDGIPNASDQPGDEAQECFPDGLRYRMGSDGNLTDERTEPIAADARDGGDGRDDALLKLLAGLLAVNFNDLKQREAIEARRRARIAKMIAVGMSVLALAAVAGGVFAFFKQQEAEVARGFAEEQRLAAEEARRTAETERDAALIAQSRFLAKLSREEQVAGDPTLAILLALEALPQSLDAPTRPLVTAASGALQSALQGQTDLRYLPHGQAVTEVGISLDGDWAYTVAIDDGVRLWTADMVEVARLGGAEMSNPDDVAFSPDSRHILIEARGRVQVWRLDANPKMIIDLEASDIKGPQVGDFPSIGGVAFSPDGVRLAIIEQTGRLTIVDLSTGEMRTQITENAAEDKTWFSLAWSLSGVVAVHNGQILEVIDPENFATLHTLELYEEALTVAPVINSISRKNDLLLINGDVEIVVVDPAGPTVIRRIKSEDQRAIAFSDDGEHLLIPDRAYGSNGQVIIQNALTGLEIARHPYLVGGQALVALAMPSGGGIYFEIHTNKVALRDVTSGDILAMRSIGSEAPGTSNFAGAVHLPNSNRLLLGSWRKSAMLWSYRENMPPLLIAHKGQNFDRLDWVAEGENILLSGHNGPPLLVNSTTGSALSHLGTDSVQSEWIVVSPNYDQILIGPDNTPLSLWNATTGTQIWQAKDCLLRSNGAIFAKEGILVASSCGTNSHMSLLDAAAGQILRVYLDPVPGDNFGLINAEYLVKGAEDRIFSSSSSCIYSDLDCRVLIWQLDKETPLAVVATRNSGISDLVALPSKKAVIGIFQDGHMIAWDGRSGKTLWDVEAHQSLFSIFTGGTGEYVVTISRSFDDHDGPMIWNTETGEMLAHIETLKGFGIVPDPVFDPNGRWIQFSGPPKIGETDGQVLLWDTNSHQMTASASHPGSIGNATVDGQGRLIARVEGAGIALWDGPDLIRLQHLADGEATPHALEFSPNGERIAVTVPEAATRIGRVPVFNQSLMDAGRHITGRTLTPEERARYFLSD